MDTLTPNQIVAFNLRRARELKGWTQDEAAEHLEPHLGARWSKASYSAAERSVDGERIREFTADDLVAFARTFRLPIAWFLTPPGGEEFGDVAKVRTPDHPDGLSTGELLDLLYEMGGPLAARLTQLGEALPAQQTTRLQRRARGMAHDYYVGLVHGQLQSQSIDADATKTMRRLLDALDKAYEETIYHGAERLVQERFNAEGGKS